MENYHRSIRMERVCRTQLHTLPERISGEETLIGNTCGIKVQKLQRVGG